MAAPPMLHPADETLGNYRSGRLEERGASAVRMHLDLCEECRRRLAAIPSEHDPHTTRDAVEATDTLPMPEPQADATRTHVRPKTPMPPVAESLPSALADHPDYSIKRELGRGGMGVVYLAHNTLMGRDEVLKVMSGRIMERPGVLERFLREIRAVAKLRHPNIVTAYSASRRGEGIVFAMELVEGLDLSKLVRIKGPIPVAHACHFVYQAALGLQHAHENGLVHRDIKPGNLMLSRVGNRATVKVLDFGLAKLSREDGGLTQDGQALGTPNYMAPEQVLDAQNADIRADIYSLGATLYHLLTGRPPFQARSLVEIYQAHISSAPDPLNQLRPDVPIELARVVETMMAKDPSSRFQTPDEVAQALAPFFKKGHGAVKGPSEALSMTPPPSTLATRPSATPRKALDATVRESGWENLVVLDEMEGSSDPATGGEPAKRPTWLGPALVFGVLVIGFVTAWASGVFKFGRDDGATRKGNLGEVPAYWPGDFPNAVSLPPRINPTSDAEKEPENTPETKTDDPAGSEHAALASRSTSGAPDQGGLPKPANSSSERDSSGFQPVFAGVDLAGWVPRGCRANDWLVQDGSLSFRAANDRSFTPNPRLAPSERRKQLFRVRNDRAAVLFTERSYSDFVLRLKFHASGAANSGIVLSDLDRGDRLPRFAEFAISLSDTPGWKTGDFQTWNFGNPVRQAPARSVALKDGDAWNTLELESRQGSLRLSLNGHQVDYDGALTLEGPRRIGLRGMSGDVRYRNIEIRGEPATLAGANGQPGLLLERVIYVDDFSDPATGWGREDIDNGPGQIPFKRNYEGGLYYLEAPPNWNGFSAWNTCEPLSQDFQFEVVGRVLGEDNRSPGGWTLIIDGPAGRGLQVTIDRLGRIAVEPAFWRAEKYPNDPRLGPFTHPAIRPGNEWNELTLRVRKRQMEVFVNSMRVCEPLRLSWDLTPAVPQIAVWKPELPSRIRAEFDWLEVRELKVDSP